MQDVDAQPLPVDISCTLKCIHPCPFSFLAKSTASSCSNCLLISLVTRIWSLIDFIHNNSPQICYIRNINSAFKSENSIFFQFISLIPLLKTLLLQLVFYLLIQFISNNMTNNLLPQIRLENAKRCHMYFLHFPAECISYLILFSLYVLDFEIKLT